MKWNRARTAYIAMLGVLAFGLATPLFAHHSKSMYDLDKTINFECTVTEVAWGNPHVLFLADVKAPGSVTNWNLEGPSPNVLVSKGLKADTLKVGDKITVTGNPRKDGKPHMLLVTVTDTSGKHYTLVDNQ